MEHNPNMKTRHGWYSAKAEALYGSVVYKSESGGSVIVTTVMDDKDSLYGFDDKVYQGLVTAYMGDHRLAPGERLGMGEWRKS